MSGFTVNFFVVLSGILLAIGIYGLASKKGMIRILISIEIMLAGVLINFVALPAMGLIEGRVFAIIAVLLAATEMAIGVGIAILLEKVYGSTSVSERKELRG